MKQLKRLRAKKAGPKREYKLGNDEWKALAGGTGYQEAMRWSGPLPPRPSFNLRPDEVLAKPHKPAMPDTFLQGQAIVMGWRKEARERYHQSEAYRADQKRKAAKRKAEKEQKCA